MEVWLYAIIEALDGSSDQPKALAAPSPRGKKTQNPLNKTLDGSRAGLDPVENKKFYAPAGNVELITFGPAQSRTDWATPAPKQKDKEEE